MRKINVLVASVLLSVAYASGGLVTLSDKRWPAYLDLAPLKNGLPLLSGRDDGIPDSPLFHGVLWIISELLGMGAGVVVASALCVFVFILRNFGIIASNVFVDYSLYIGSGIEMIILSLAIVEKFKAYRNEALENLKSLNELIDRKNIDLEIQVKERTL